MPKALAASRTLINVPWMDNKYGMPLSSKQWFEDKMKFTLFHLPVTHSFVLEVSPLPPTPNYGGLKVQ